MSLQKDGSIIIGAADFRKGIGQSPYVGMGAMVNLDIHSQPGVLKINYALVKESASTVVKKIQSFGFDSAGQVIGLDNGGQSYTRTTSGVWSTLNAFGTTDDGFAVWKNYAIAINKTSDTQITYDAYGPLVGGGASEDSGWATATNSGGTKFPTFVSIGDSLYIAAGKFLHSFTEVAGQNFDPASGATFTEAEEVLVLPEGYIITALNQIGGNIIVGTEYEDSRTSADLFVWNPNKSGSSAADADIRIPLGGSGVKSIQVFDNIAHTMVGNFGAIKLTDLTNINRLITLGDTTATPDSPFFFNVADQFSALHDDGVLFGAGHDSATADEQVIYYLKNGAWTSFTTSLGSSAVGITIGAMTSVSDQAYLVAWQNNLGVLTYGVDALSTDTRYQSYSAYFESQVYRVGRPLRDKTLQHVGFKLTKPLTADQGVRVKYRENINDSFTVAKTWDFATDGAISGAEAQANLPSNLENLQLRVELTTGTSDTTPELQEIYLI